ncbi:MAG TPA: CARDB domain-containing protein [Capsulimonadaceae bacterium]|jgi:hypothetical protein
MSIRPVLLAVLLCVSAVAHAETLTWEVAPRADDFVDSIGVCTHFSYSDTPYGKIYDTVKQRLADSGIRHVRDGYSVRTPDLWKDLGVRTSVLAEPKMGSLEKQLALWKSTPGMIGMIEGPNEPNLFWKRFGTQYKGEGWPKGVKLWQNELYAAVKADPIMAAVPVSSPTPIFDGPLEAAPLTSFDYMALHPYAGGNMPSTSCQWGGSAIRAAVQLLGHDNDLKPIVATECGYHNCIAGDAVLAGTQPGISETAGGRYFTRHFAEYWNAGFARTYVYEFVDEKDRPTDPEAHFGLLRLDASPKPAYTAISNMIALLSEGKWDAASLQWTRKPSTTAVALRVGIDGPATVHHTLLSRADGAFDLLLWNEVSSFDLRSRKDLSPLPASVTLRLGSSMGATLYRPLAGTSIQQEWKPATAIALNVPDEVVIVRLSAPLLNGIAPAAPAALKSATTATSAMLQWGCTGRIPAAYVVKRLGRTIATITPTADGSGTFTDTALTPGMGYPYSVVAVASNGIVSAPALVTARTPNQRADLIVKSVAWTPAQPKAGDEVQFSAVIANVGSEASPAITHGVAFAVDGKTVNWSDTSKDPLAPGETRALAANNGPAAKGTWTCTDGTFQVVAKVDDVNRIDESNKQNNSSKAILSTGSGSDLLVVAVHVDGAAMVGQPVKLIGTVRNAGRQSTPDGVTISCTFIATDGSGKKGGVGYGVLHRILAAGESVDVPIERPWVPTAAGTYFIVGVADDIDRIAETNEANNTSPSITVEVK